MLLGIPIPPEVVRPLFEATNAACNPELTEVLLRLGADPNRLTEEIHALESMIGYAVGHPSFPSDQDKQTRALECIRLVIAAGALWNPGPERLGQIRRKLTAGAPEVVSSIVSILRENHVLTDEQLHELTRTQSMRRVLSGHGRPQKPTDDLYGAAYRPAITAPTPSGYWKRHWSKR